MVCSNGGSSQREWKSTHLCGSHTPQQERPEGETSSSSRRAVFGTAVVFTTLDANSRIWQIPFLLTTFITPFGRYCFHRLPFGITSAPEHFQRRMSDILSDLEGVVCMMDDVLVHGGTREEHNQRLDNVLQRMSDVGMTLNRQKCHFSQSQVKFLGQIIIRMESILTTRRCGQSRSL